MEKMAGIESTANKMSVNAITTTITKMGVMNNFPFLVRIKKRPITFRLKTLKYLDKNFTIGCSPGFISCSSSWETSILIPV